MSQQQKEQNDAQQSLNFTELRAKFGACAGKEAEVNKNKKRNAGQQQHGGTTGSANINSRNEKKSATTKAFSKFPMGKPAKVASNKSTGPSCTLSPPAACKLASNRSEQKPQTGKQANQPSETSEKGEGVRKLVERFNKIGPDNNYSSIVDVPPTEAPTDVPAASTLKVEKGQRKRRSTFSSLCDSLGDAGEGSRRPSSSSKEGDRTLITGILQEMLAKGLFTELEPAMKPPRRPYKTGDPEEERRLRELQSVALEFYSMQRGFVQLLRHIGVNYPMFLTECERRLAKCWLSPVADGPHVITRIAGHFQVILGVHEMFLKEFGAKMLKWDSRRPDLSSILRTKADFLKICSDFLKAKSRLVAELQRALEENRKLAYASREFEQAVFGGGGITIPMQLDAVHQNVVRYKLLMERYRKHLRDHSTEAASADEALANLAAVSGAVNQFLTGTEAEKKLLDLHRKLGGVFDVFAPGRRLLHESELFKQTRKELQPRYLVLFSTSLLICRYVPLSTEILDVNRLYEIPMDGQVRVHCEEHEDYELEFVIQSPLKSSAFVAKSRRERDLWVQRIGDACRAAVVGAGAMAEHRSHLGGGSNPSASVSSSSQTPKVASSAPVPPPPPPEDPHHQLLELEPPWIPDHRASKCLMAGCATHFSLWRRKHHCRQCGWLICGQCVGQAPVRVKGWRRMKVCPQCYQENKTAFEHGLLFPTNMIVDGIVVEVDQLAPAKAAENASKLPKTCNKQENLDTQRKKYSVADPKLHIAFEDEMKGPRLVHIADLFVPPANDTLSKAKIPMKEQALAWGKVFLRSRRGFQVDKRWAILTHECHLRFYTAEFDDQPSESFFVYGYSMSAQETEEGGTEIELSHRNQIRTAEDSKEAEKARKITFHVLHSRSAEKWLEALENALRIEEPLEDEEDAKKE